MPVSPHEFFLLFLVSICLKKLLLKLTEVENPLQLELAVSETSNFVSSAVM
jgi:hypothetical protein